MLLPKSIFWKTNGKNVTETKTMRSRETNKKMGTQQIDMKYATFQIDFWVQVLKRSIEKFSIAAASRSKNTIKYWLYLWKKFDLMSSDIWN